MSESYAIHASQLSFQYEKAQTPALQEIDVTVEQGQFVALMGETGSGKTSLLMALNGLIPQFVEGDYQGEVIMNNLSTLLVPTQKLVETVGLVLQDPETQIFGMNIWEDVAFGPSNLGVSLDEIERRVQQVLQWVDLQGKEGQSTEFLSGGEKQRLAIAGILAIGPKILLLDEPTSELDPQGKERIFSIIQELKERHNLTIIMAEHESEHILEHAEQVIVLQEGKIAWQGEPSRLFADEEKVKSFHLKPPGVATLYWEWKKRGISLGGTCPRNVTEIVQRFNEWLQRYSRAHRDHFDIADDSPRAKKTESKVILDVQNLIHTYPNGHQAVQKIDLQIVEGDCIALIGPNGAGKSTLCKHFNGLLQPTQGRIFFQNEELKGNDTSYWAKRIGYVFQNPDNQIFSTSVIEEVMYGLKLQNIPLALQLEKAEEVLRFLGLEIYRDIHPFNLNKGLRQLLAIASVLVLEPEVLVIDEPTTGQDYQGVENILSLVKKLHSKGHTILMITHDMNLVTRVANRVLIMDHGKIIRDCSPAQAFTDEQILRRAHIAPPQVVAVADELRKQFSLPSEMISHTQLSDELWKRVNKYA